MEKLKERIEECKKKLPKDAQQLVEDGYLDLCSKYPFNRYTNIFSVLLKKGDLSYDEYERIRDGYFKRNPNLDLFEMSPRSFGQTWGEEWLTKQNIGLIKSTNNQYDLWLPLQNNDGIKIEVKSSRVIALDDKRPPVEKAHKKPKGTPEEIASAIYNLPFKMNFQQLKPSCCDVFIWMAVWLDEIDIWVIPSSKIKIRDQNTPKRKRNESIVSDDGILYMGSQHQGGKGGKTPEGQIFVTNHHYKDLGRYKATLDNLIDKIEKYGNSN